MEFLQALFAVDWSGLIAAAVASGVGLTAVTQLLKTKWVAVPAKAHPRVVTAVLAVFVGVISTFATGLELSSLTSLVVFVVVSFIVSGLAYDSVKGLVGEVKEITDDQPAAPEAETIEQPVATTTMSVSAPKTVDEVAGEIIKGVKDDGTSWGNGDDRRANLEAAGYDYGEVQSAVKKLVAKQKQKG